MNFQEEMRQVWYHSNLYQISRFFSEICWEICFLSNELRMNSHFSAFLYSFSKIATSLIPRIFNDLRLEKNWNKRWRKKKERRSWSKIPCAESSWGRLVCTDDLSILCSSSVRRIHFESSKWFSEIWNVTKSSFLTHFNLFHSFLFLYSNRWV